MTDCKSTPGFLNEPPLTVDGLVNLSGEQIKGLHFERVENLISSYQASIVASPQMTKEQRETLNKNTQALNKFLREEIEYHNTNEEFVSLPFNEDYPNITRRIGQLPFITQAETHRFITQFTFTPFTFTRYLVPLNFRMLRLLDNFFSLRNISSTTMGSFCSLVPNVFAAFSEFQNIWNNASSFAGQFDSLTSAFQTGGLSGLVNQIKQQIFSVIDNVVQKYKGVLENYSVSFSDVAAAGVFLYQLKSSGAKSRHLKNKLGMLVSDSYIEHLKKRVEGLIAYATSLFDQETIGIEEIQFLILRFCELAGSIEQMFNGFIHPLKTIQSNYESSAVALNRAGNIAQSQAITGGASRLSATQKNQGREAAKSVPARARGAGGASDTGRNPGFAIRSRSANIIPPTSEEFNEIPSYEQVSRNFSLFRFNRGAQGWEKVQTLELVMLLRLAKKWGSMFNINSAWRSVGRGASTSFHFSGQAFDVSIPPSQHRRFADLARSEGFGGIGTYSTFIHIDSGRERVWAGQQYPGRLSDISGIRNRI